MEDNGKKQPFMTAESARIYAVVPIAIAGLLILDGEDPIRAVGATVIVCAVILGLFYAWFTVSDWLRSRRS